MKKFSAVFLLIIMLAAPAFAAVSQSTPDIDVNGYAAATELRIDLGTEKTSIALKVAPGVDVYFDRLNGLDTRFSLSIEGSKTNLGIDIGYARKFPMENRNAASLKTGFFWNIDLQSKDSNTQNLGLYFRTDIMFNMYKELYLMIGFEDRVTIGTVKTSRGKSETEAGFDSVLVLPTVGFGYKF